MGNLQKEEHKRVDGNIGTSGTKNLYYNKEGAITDCQSCRPIPVCTIGIHQSSKINHIYKASDWLSKSKNSSVDEFAVAH